MAGNSENGSEDNMLLSENEFSTRSKRTILVADDNSVNRKILAKILADQYNVLEAGNGQDAIEKMRLNANKLSLVLLDIVMPVMDGYAVLEKTKNDVNLSGIPIIMITGSRNSEDEIRCLDEGASDFLVKPFNPEIVKHRINAVIRLSEKSKLINKLELDELTGVYSKDFFYTYTTEMLAANTDVKYDLICSDVENFKMINERYGNDVGDDVLRSIARNYTDDKGKYKLCGRLAANVFAVLVEHNDNYTNDMFVEHTESVLSTVPLKTLVMKYGIYEIHDSSVSVSKMCDRAILAINSIKHRYGRLYSFYDDELRLRLLKDQQILDSMEDGLSEHQFVIYLQPKHSIKTKDVIGAEALVRWIHPKRGFMPPGDFIPLFERNGFITLLDEYVWEEACIYIKKRMDTGKRLVPISVNVSRIDFEVLDLPAHIKALTEKYGIPSNMLNLEVTETAYADNPQKVVADVEKLRSQGFRIEMDDFGSGYSSLNMLSEFPIDIIKLDMKFMKRHKNATNNRSILSFILSLSKWLGLPTIAEGVETEYEFELLRSMGCNYVQGYYFAKPMPVDEFDAYEDNVRKEIEAETNRLKKANPIEKGRDTVLILETVESDGVCGEMLQKHYNVINSAESMQAYASMQNKHSSISAVIIDSTIKEQEALEFTQLLKHDAYMADIPILMLREDNLTPEMFYAEEEKALSHGIFAVMEKPFSEFALLHRVRTAIMLKELMELKRTIEISTNKVASEEYRDRLTALLNFRGLKTSIENIKNSAHTVILLDIDELRTYNEKGGVEYGDKILVAVAEALKRIVREGDYVARVGSDEFMIVLKNLLDGKNTIDNKMSMIQRELKNIDIDGEKVGLSVTAAVEQMPVGAVINDIFQSAKSTLYTAKSTAMGSYIITENDGGDA